MFTFQNMTSKRRREDDSDSEDGGGHGYGYSGQQPKKSCTWFSDPVSHSRVQSPSSQGLPLRPTLTPPHMASDIGLTTPARPEYVATDSPQSAHEDDFDMDMDDDSGIRSQPQSPFADTHFMRPAMLNASLFAAHPTNPVGRIPTPIHPTFQRGGLTGTGFPSIASASGPNTNSGGLSLSSMQASTSRKNNRQDMKEERGRRMPSPISEDEDIPDTPTEFTQSQLSRLSFSQANPTDEMETDMAPTAPALPPSTRGRKRSGALTSMGRFSMGFREDCDKCRQRVPGHYSHFL